MNFTPGKWHGHDGQISSELTGRTIAIIPYFDKGNQEMVDNQKLFSNAKELLEALTPLVNFCSVVPLSVFNEQAAKDFLALYRSGQRVISQIKY